jgi:hypothetical protein
VRDGDPRRRHVRQDPGEQVRADRRPPPGRPGQHLRLQGGHPPDPTDDHTDPLGVDVAAHLDAGVGESVGGGEQGEDDDPVQHPGLRPGRHRPRVDVGQQAGHVQ